MSLPRDHVLGDGTTVRLREVTATDAPLLLDMWGRTSPESRRTRFMGPFRLDASNASRFVELDPTHQFAVVATRGRDVTERMIGIARYELDTDDVGALALDLGNGSAVAEAIGCIERNLVELLRGYRGSAPADVTALKGLIHRVNAMVEDLPEVAELNLNPVFVCPDGQGVVAVDVRLRLAPTPRPSR